MGDWQKAIHEHIDEASGELRAIRRYLHAHPEPSGGEFQTTLYLADRLKHGGIDSRIIPSERGIIAEPATQASIPRVAMRAELDALLLHDEKKVEYCSTEEGLMHACGHDAHSTMVLGASIALHHCQKELPWPIAWRSIFQPAEETSEGGLEMVEAGAVENVRSIVALHVDPELAVGRVAMRSGALTAFCEGIDVLIHGRGGHAARPHHTIDPIAVATGFVSSIYQLVPRSIDSREPVVVSFGVIEGGKNRNVIPEQVELRGTIRTVNRTSTTQVKERIRSIARGFSEASNARIEVCFRSGLDAVINDPAVTDVCAEAAGSVVGRQHVDKIKLPSMGGEDFSAYLARVPGCLFRLGAASEHGPRHFLHSPCFDIDERALAIGAKILAEAVVRISRPSEDRDLGFGL